MAPKSKADAPVFTAETVACMIAVMELKGATLGTKAYQLMAKLDGTRTASGFEHQFRTVKARGKVLAAELSNETATPTAKTPKTPKTAKKPATASTKKRNNKTANEGDDDDEDKVAVDTPSKKTKIKKEPSLDAPEGEDSTFFEDAMPLP